MVFFIRRRKKKEIKLALDSKIAENRSYVDKHQCSRITSPRYFQRPVSETIKGREICGQKCERSLGRV